MVGACWGFREIDSRPASSTGQALRGNDGETIAGHGSRNPREGHCRLLFRLDHAGAVIGNNLQMLHLLFIDNPQ